MSWFKRSGRINIFGQNLANSRETGHVKRFVCLTPSGRGTAVIKCRFYAGFGWRNGIWRERVPQKKLRYTQKRFRFLKKYFDILGRMKKVRHVLKKMKDLALPILCKFLHILTRLLQICKGHSWSDRYRSIPIQPEWLCHCNHLVLARNVYDRNHCPLAIPDRKVDCLWFHRIEIIFYLNRQRSIKNTAVAVLCWYPALNDTSHDFRSIPNKHPAQRTDVMGCSGITHAVFIITRELQILKNGAPQ